MARPLRIEFSGALYHITSRGDRREAIYEGDDDRRCFLSVLSDVCVSHNWVCHAYCLMGNHYHLLIETPDANLCSGMRQLNGVYTQRFNRSYNRVGHVFQGRYKSILVDGDQYLLELARYVVLNPVRAGMVLQAGDWPWSSYGPTVGAVAAPDFLQPDWLLSNFGHNKQKAIERYRRFVGEGEGQPSPWENLRQQIYLGSDEFVASMQHSVDDDKPLADIPRVQSRPAVPPIRSFERSGCSRNEAIARAYQSGGYTLKEIGAYFGLHYSTVSVLVKHQKSKTRP